MVFDNRKKENGNERQLPDEVLDRLKGYAEANDTDLDGAIQKFVEYLSDKFAVDNWQDEDDDFLIEASEGMVVPVDVEDASRTNLSPGRTPFS